MLSRSLLRTLRTVPLRRLSSITESQSNPDNFSGVHTKYGWVLVKKTHVARGWTQGEINSALDEKLGGSPQKHDFSEIQQAVDDWTELADSSLKPKFRKKTREDKAKGDQLRLYMRQQKYDDADAVADAEVASDTTEAGGETRAAPKKQRQYKPVQPNSVTFNNAWNYYQTVKFPHGTEMTVAEAKQKLGLEWRLLTLEERECYRQEYQRLLQSGKDIWRGKIVDREFKAEQSRRAWEAKERAKQKRLAKS